jgi:hypothetical protein
MRIEQERYVLHVYLTFNFHVPNHGGHRYWLTRLEDILNPLISRHGSMSILQADQIPEAAGGFHIIRQWAMNILYKIEPHGRPNVLNWFLTDFLKATTIGSYVDKHILQGGLGNVPCVTSPKQRHPGLFVDGVSGPHTVYVLHSLIRFLRGAGERDMEEGALFFRQAHLP